MTTQHPDFDFIDPAEIDALRNEPVPVFTVFVGSRDAREMPATLIKQSDEPFGRLLLCVSFETHAQALDHARAEIVDMVRREWSREIDERDRDAMTEALADLKACGLFWTIKPTEFVADFRNRADMHSLDWRNPAHNSNIG